MYQILTRVIDFDVNDSWHYKVQSGGLLCRWNSYRCFTYLYILFEAYCVTGASSMALQIVAVVLLMCFYMEHLRNSVMSMLFLCSHNNSILFK